MSDPTLFLKRGEKVFGPYSLNQVNELNSQGKLKPDDLISRSIKGPWKRCVEATGSKPISKPQKVSPPQASYFLKLGEEICGPKSLTQIKELCSSEKFNPDDLISTSQNGPWRKFSEISHKLGIRSKLIVCSDCQSKVSRRAAACPQCGGPLQDTHNSTSSTLDKQETQISIQPIGQGKFVCTGPYGRLFECVTQALNESDVKIISSSLHTGEIAGNTPFGINAFGMKVYSRIFAQGGSTVIEITASFTDAFDTMGDCKKKIHQISENLLCAAGTLYEQEISRLDNGQAIHNDVNSSAPSPLVQVGESFKGKATIGLYLSLGGLLLAPLAIAGVIMCGSAYGSIAASNNEEGKDIAIAGSVVGIVVLVIWFLVVVSL